MVKHRTMAEPAFDHFGALAPLYDRWISPPDAAMLLRLVEPRPEDVLLDVGGGTGRVAQVFRGFVRHVCIVDVSERMLRQAQAKGGLCVRQGASERLPFRDGAFQRIIAVDSFHHFRDQVRASAELLRVLAPAGRLVIEEPDIRRFAVKLIALGEKLMLMRSRFLKPQDMMRLFASAETRVHMIENESTNVWVVVEK